MGKYLERVYGTLSVSVCYNFMTVAWVVLARWDVFNFAYSSGIFKFMIYSRWLSASRFLELYVYNWCVFTFIALRSVPPHHLFIEVCCTKCNIFWVKNSYGIRKEFPEFLFYQIAPFWPNISDGATLPEVYYALIYIFCFIYSWSVWFFSTIK